MEWLWSLTDSFVICFCSLFWTRPYTTFISIPIILNLLTKKTTALIAHGQGTSTVVFISDFTSFHNRCPLLTLCNRSLKKQPTFRDASSGFPAKWCLRNERRNSILMTRHPQIWVLLMTGRSKFQPIRSTIQIWVATCHQNGISVVVSQTSLRGETRGGVGKCRLFS